MSTITRTISFTGDETIINGAIDALVYHNGYKDDSGVTKLEFAKDLIRQYVRANVEAYQVIQAQAAARVAAAEAVASQLNSITTEVEW